MAGDSVRGVPGTVAFRTTPSEDFPGRACQLGRLQRVGVDLLPHPVHVLRHDVVDVHRPRLAVAQAASRHHDNLQRQARVSDGERFRHVSERGNGNR